MSLAESVINLIFSIYISIIFNLRASDCHSLFYRIYFLKSTEKSSDTGKDLNSFITRTILTAAAIRSATGPAYMIPSIPINSGRRIISGRRKRICLVRDRKIPFFGFPMDVKKLELMGCIPFRKVKNRKIRK